MTNKKGFCLSFLVVAGTVLLAVHPFWPSGPTFAYLPAVSSPTNSNWAEGNSFLIQENRPMSLTLETNNTNGGVFGLVTAPSHGVLSPFVAGSNNRTARVLYTPDDNFRGVDTFTYQVVVNGTISTPATVSLHVLPKLIPWVEINLPASDIFDFYPKASMANASMDGIDFAVAGLEHWAKVTDRVIITTTPGRSSLLYPELENRKPSGLKIFGGLKTANILPVTGSQNGVANYNFSHLASWQSLATEAQQIVDYTGNSIVVLENETALWNYHMGFNTINYSELAQVLAQTLKPLADGGIVFWWWLPNYFPDLPLVNGAAETTQFVNTIKSVLPNSVFMTQYSAKYWWNSTDNTNRNMMTDLVGLPQMIEAIWLDQDGTTASGARFYTPAESIAELEGTLVRSGESAQPFPVLTEEVELYPGAGEWIISGYTFANLLPELASTNTSGFSFPNSDDPPTEEDNPPVNDGGGGGNGDDDNNETMTSPVTNPSPSVSSSQSPCVPVAPPPLLVGPLHVGMKNNNQVVLLQRLLATDPTIYPEGIVSGFYGPLTRAAVQRFQIKYGILTINSDPELLGFAGPRTRAKINAVLGQGSTTCSEQNQTQITNSLLRLLLQRLFELLRPNFYPPQ